jgi:hypothetical protein
MAAGKIKFRLEGKYSKHVFKIGTDKIIAMQIILAKTLDYKYFAFV